jgi:hypothetical protein
MSAEAHPTPSLADPGWYCFVSQYDCVSYEFGHPHEPLS